MRSWNEVRDAIHACKTEIKEDVLAGRVPAERVKTFSDLHDWVDANEYGLDHLRLFTQDEIMDVLDVVDLWIRAGGHVLLDADTVSAIGLDATGRDGDPRFPYSAVDLDGRERERLEALQGASR